MDTSGISIAFVKFLVLNWFFLKEPLWWSAVLFTTLYFYNNRLPSSLIFKKVKEITLISWLVFYVISGLLIYIPVLYFTNGSLPLRAENIICFLYSLMLLLIISICIFSKINNISAGTFYNHRYLLLSILIFSTVNMKKVTDSLLSGYFYNLVMKERLSLLKNAQLQNEHEITFDNYETAVNKKIKEYFPAVNRQLLKNIILKPPPIICFENDLYDINYLKELYGIKKLNVRKE